jgi:histone deacetylase complex regulatory component SIN3
VAKLFATAPDLIGEFKQFLPEDRDSSIFTSLMEAEPMEKSRRAGTGKDTKKKRGPAGDPKNAKVSLHSRQTTDVSVPRLRKRPTARP